MVERNGETQPQPVVHALQGTLHLCEACFDPINKLFGQERLVKAPGLDRGNANLRQKSQETHLISIAENVGQGSTSNRCTNYQLEHLAEIVHKRIFINTAKGNKGVRCQLLYRLLEAAWND